MSHQQVIDDQKIPDAAKLLKSFRRNRRISMLILILVIVINLALSVLIINSHNMYYYALALGALALSLYNFMRDYLFYFIRNKTELSNIKEQSIGNYRTEEIKNLVDHIFSNFKGHEIPRIYIVDDPLASAHVIDTYILNFIGPINAIYIPRNP